MNNDPGRPKNVDPSEERMRQQLMLCLDYVEAVAADEVRQLASGEVPQLSLISAQDPDPTAGHTHHRRKYRVPVAGNSRLTVDHDLTSNDDYHRVAYSWARLSPMPPDIQFFEFDDDPGNIIPAWIQGGIIEHVDPDERARRVSGILPMYHVEIPWAPGYFIHAIVSIVDTEALETYSNTELRRQLEKAITLAGQNNPVVHTVNRQGINDNTLAIGLAASRANMTDVVEVVGTNLTALARSGGIPTPEEWGALRSHDDLTPET